MGLRVGRVCGYCVMLACVRSLVWFVHYCCVIANGSFVSGFEFRCCMVLYRCLWFVCVRIDASFVHDCWLLFRVGLCSDLCFVCAWLQVIAYGPLGFGFWLRVCMIVGYCLLFACGSVCAGLWVIVNGSAGFGFWFMLGRIAGYCVWFIGLGFGASLGQCLLFFNV